MQPSSLHHSFDLNIAQEYGVDEAIMIHHFQYWIHYNIRLKKNCHEGRTWTYQTLEEITAHFPYWNKDQVRRVMKRLEEEGVLIKGNYNKVNYDRTVWYAFKDQRKFLPETEKSPNENIDFSQHMAKSPHGCGENASPIPDNINTYISPIVPEGDQIPSKRKKLKEPKEEVAPSVHLTPSQQKDVFKRLQQTEVTPAMCYDKLSQWKIGKGISGGSDYGNIIKWVVNAVKNDLSKPKPMDMASENQNLAESIKNAFPNNADIKVGVGYIEFDFGPMNHPHIKFTDHGFRERVENNLRKMGLRI